MNASDLKFSQKESNKDDKYNVKEVKRKVEKEKGAKGKVKKKHKTSDRV